METSPWGERASAGRRLPIDNIWAITFRGCLTNYLIYCRRHKKCSLNGLDWPFRMWYLVFVIRMKGFFHWFPGESEMLMLSFLICTSIVHHRQLIWRHWPRFKAQSKKNSAQEAHWRAWQRNRQRNRWQMCRSSLSNATGRKRLTKDRVRLGRRLPANTQLRSFHMLTFWVKGFTGGWDADARLPPLWCPSSTRAEEDAAHSSAPALSDDLDLSSQLSPSSTLPLVGVVTFTFAAIELRRNAASSVLKACRRNVCPMWSLIQMQCASQIAVLFPCLEGIKRYRSEGLCDLHDVYWWNNVCFFLLCQTLLDLGASPDYKDSRGLTPLYHSSMVGGDPYCCELLLHDHAQVGCVDENGWQEIHQVIGSLFLKRTSSSCLLHSLRA